MGYLDTLEKDGNEARCRNVGDRPVFARSIHEDAAQRQGSHNQEIPRCGCGITVFGAHANRSIYVVSLSTLILFVVTYDRFSKPINRLQTEAAKTRKQLDNAACASAGWDRSLLMRVPLLTLSMLAQCFALLSTLAERHC